MLSKMNKNDQKQLAQYLAGRSTQIPHDVLLKASEIVEDVQKNGDAAIKKYTEKFDGVEVLNLRISQDQIDEAAAQADPAFVSALKEAKENIEAFHIAQKQEGYRLDKEDGVFLGQRVLPLKAVGIYVPGGRAQYPSSVLMNAVPAKVAGVKRVVMITPPSKTGTIHPNIAAAAKVAGIDEIYLVGGAQGIAALAYGTESIPAVDKITGPGNIYVNAAKKLVFGKVDIDMIAGPSEILVIADEKANPEFVAADLLSQAEHDPMASSILVSTSARLIDEVNDALVKQTAVLPKKEIVEQSLKNYGVSILCDTLEECAEVSNEIAPEHLELQIADPEALLDRIENAGSVFMGYITCESIGDYFGGTNHVLPTSGTARFSSALGVDAFIKKSSFLNYTPQALKKHGHKIICMATQEDLDAHANAVKVRLEADQDE